MIDERTKYYQDFDRAVKIFNSEWEPSDISESANIKGEHFLSCSIVTNYGWKPTMKDCLAIAEYLRVTYRKGYFYKKIN